MLIFFVITFSINAKEYDVGQENLYKDPCEDWLDLVQRRLTWLHMHMLVIGDD